MKMILIKGKRINLRSFKKSDAEHLCENIKPKIIKRYTANIPHPYNLKHAVIFIKKSKLRERKKEDYSLGIELKESDVLPTLKGWGFLAITQTATL